MNSNECIEQKGIIEHISASKIKIRIQPLSVCNSCQTKSLCNIKGNQSNIIEITDKSGSFSVGDVVNILVKKSTGYTALFLGYMLPLIIVLFFIFLFSGLGYNEVIAGAGSLLMLAPYYLILYSLRHNIRKRIKITISKSLIA
jgi:positive regulator of sigma E activity